MTVRSLLRWAPFVVLAVVFFALALNGDAYNATSPPRLGNAHVWLRKAYSIVAFAAIGAAYAHARRSTHPWDAGFAIALFSGAIEIGQWFVSTETLLWNAVDVACGFAGGVLGAAAYLRSVSRRR